MQDSITAIDVQFETNVDIENKTLEQLTAETNTFYHQAERFAGMSATMLAESGRRIIEMKKRIPHGEFGNWCENNLDFSYRKAARMMQLAEKMADENSIFSKMPTLADIGISRVWELLAAPEEVVAEVVEEHDVTDMTVRELKEEIARIKSENAEEMAKIKAEKADAERKASIIEHNNDDIRRELASMQMKLADSVSEKEFEEMQEAARVQKEDLTKELREVKASSAEIQAKLDKAKEDLKKQKAKQKELEASKDEEVRKGVEEAKADIEKKAKEEGAADAAAALAQNAEEIAGLQAEIEKLEAEKAKLSNTSLMEFKVLTDQLQDIYYKINDLITDESTTNEDLGDKMRGALQKLIGEWRP